MEGLCFQSEWNRANFSVSVIPLWSDGGAFYIFMAIQVLHVREQSLLVTIGFKVIFARGYDR